MTTVVAPFKVVSTLPTRGGLQVSVAEDAQGQKLWLFTHADASPAAAQRLLAGAKACSGDGPWLEVLGCGIDGGRAWAVTLPLAGQTITELLRARGAVEGLEMMNVVSPVCTALQQLGERGHAAAIGNDLVLVDAKGEGRLIGFAPEAAGPVVPALGAMMYELLKGVPPADGPDEMIGVRAQLADFVRACLEGRLASPGVVGEQLHIVGRGETVDLAKLMPGSATPVHDTAVSTNPKAASEGQRVGEVLGSYQLMRRLGEGGMGEVYLGKHLKLGREVAVKVLRAEMAKDPEIIARFFQEAKVVNDINHPHIVEVIDFAEEVGKAYCVMELLKGHTLESVLEEKGGSLDVTRTCNIMAQVAEALHAAHQRGVVHRDVKPANVFLTERDGRADFVKVLDFGIARVAKAEGSRTQVGMVLGTPAYMSPEQAQGRVVDGRSDVYSLGAVLYELLAGRVLSKELFTPPPLVDTARGEPVPAALAEVVQQCLEMDPGRRPATALEVAQRLAKAIPKAVASDTQRALVEAGLKAAPKKSRARTFAVAAVMLVAMAGLALYFARPGEAKTDAMVPMPPPQQRVKVSAPPDVMLPDDPRSATVVVVNPKPGSGPTPTPVKTRNRPIAKRGEAVTHVEVVAPPPSVAVQPPDPRNTYAPQMTKLQREYDGLVKRYGVQQLTAIEREVVRQALEDFAGGNYASLEKTLRDAEMALQAAHQRLDR